MSELSAKVSVPRSTLIKWGVVLAAAAMIWLVPCNDVYSLQVKEFLFVTATGILLVAFELVDLMAVSMMFPIG